MPFVKGDPLINRKGRPTKGTSMTEILREVMNERSVGFNNKKISGKEALARKMLSTALSGDVPASKYIFDRMDGPMKAMFDLPEELFMTPEDRAERIRELEEKRLQADIEKQA